MAIVFYDTETTGIESSFCQILQFAAILTDADLNEIDRFEIRCRLQPHIVAAPGALKVTGITAEMLTDPTLPSHYEMITIIRNKMLEWSPALFIGYNSIKFDEHFMRQALYQSLYPPYLTNTNGNSRSDVLMMVHSASIFAPDCFNFPLNEKGKPIFRLDQVAPLNGFEHENAHDALADVEATIYLCGLLSENAPEIWSNFMRFSQKAATSYYIINEDMFCLSEFYYGRHYSWLVTAIGHDQKNNSEHYVFNLEVDPSELSHLTDEELSDRLGSRPKPVRRLRSNASPILMDADDAVDSTAGKNIPTTELESRINFLNSNSSFCSRLIAAFKSNQEERPKSIYIEEQIYDGFFINSDQKLLEQFHAAPWENRLKIIESFSDERLKYFGLRLIHMERSDLLDKNALQERELTRAQRLLANAEGVPWLTLPQAIQEIEEALSELNGEDSTFLTEHRNHLISRLEKATQIAA